MLCWFTVTSLLLIWGIRQYFWVRSTSATSPIIYAVIMHGKTCQFAPKCWVIVQICTFDLFDICLWIHSHVQQRTLASFVRAWICDPLTFTYCICWVSRSSHKNVRHYCNQYFCHICCGRTGPLQSTISVCASSQLTTRGIRTLRNCLSISWWHVCQHSRVLITRRALAVTWETNRNKTNFIVLTPQQIWWGLKRNTLTHTRMMAEQTSMNIEMLMRDYKHKTTFNSLHIYSCSRGKMVSGIPLNHLKCLTWMAIMEVITQKEEKNHLKCPSASAGSESPANADHVASSQQTWQNPGHG